MPNKTVYAVIVNAAFREVLEFSLKLDFCDALNPRRLSPKHYSRCVSSFAFNVARAQYSKPL
jgi:hypothetical protein